MECLEPSAHADEDITAENVGYCVLHPECCQKADTPTPIERPKWWLRVLHAVFSKVGK